MSIRVMTCNVRCRGDWDRENHWDLRREACAEVMRSRRPDVICCQEVRPEQYVDLREALPEFDTYALPERPGSRDGVNALFWRRDRFELACGSGYWLSETPHVPGSKSWDSKYIRLANWVRLVERATKRELRVVSTHLDNVGQTARERQASLVNEDAAAYPADYPQVLAGDMNASATNPAIETYRRAGWRDACDGFSEAGPGHRTYHAFGANPPDWPERIDWIFVRGPLRSTEAQIVRDTPGGRYPSDHYFVLVELDWAD
ncbi:MAG: endonuclease/exonuclease/phosphatase family protein [Candidatus Brocadiaceae bacterium]|nr:endonuclease/exonuclease/phosphatase family protein [Candidatus Brocadiaceae bacterium]